MTDFIFWHHPTPVGIDIDEVSGCESRSGKTWREMARQIYCENGKESFREISYSDSGAPLLEGSDQRISISHADHLFVVASLPRTPESDLTRFSQRTALGVDCERSDRKQVLNIRKKFLNDAEQSMIPDDDVNMNILAWTIKEAVYKTMLHPGIDFCNAIKIVSLPELKDFDPFNLPELGKVCVDLGYNLPGSSDKKRISEDFDIYSYMSDDYIVTVAFSPKCAKFSPPRPKK